MTHHPKGSVCHILPRRDAGSAMVSFGEPEPLEAVRTKLEQLGFEASTERHGPLWFLLTDAGRDTVPGILLDHFETFYRYDLESEDLMKVTDADGHVQFDGPDGDEDEDEF